MPATAAEEAATGTEDTRRDAADGRRGGTEGARRRAGDEERRGVLDGRVARAVAASCAEKLETGSDFRVTSSN